ncbi:MAG TPA: hypothetical protein VK465_00570 [Fibrobacteria bacterium]|nr:hypothetical protein [Fibrobacteria bacterium]
MNIRLAGFGGGAPKDTFSSGYRCWADNKAHKRSSTNHMGKAADIQVEYQKAGSWTTGEKAECDKVRTLVVNKMAGQIRWASKDKFSLEPSEASYPEEFLATDWVHLDVREFNSKYLADRFFCKTDSELNGEPMVSFLGD